MPRVRTPNAEQQKQDRQIADSIATVISMLSLRYPQNGELRMAMRCLTEFAESDMPKPRVRKPKAVITVAEMAHAE